MNGVVVRKIKAISDDSRRTIFEIMNGEFGGKNIKILEVKEESHLGGTSGHYHLYPECMYIMKGKCWNYVMENIYTGEKETFEFKEGDVVFRTAGIIHGGMFAKGSIIIDIADTTYISGNYNDIPREKYKNGI